MRNFLHVAVLLLGLLILAACAAEAPLTVKSDAELCAEKGGTLQKRGMLQSEMCVIPYADAGKTCTDSAQCEGRCLASPDGFGADEEGEVSGLCEADDRTFGCYAEVIDGQKKTGICVD